ncbi:hypothetical protein TSUD_373330 [Trifolium subterraneum]|uniref:Uncharacterized protein n=1 Tax=Trifolium subterraneum TaxID=3900 RepID=A0A2Z6PI43_TRISU|nr:hypothetical protein TSUD_373330 [Trifolium subterraneum]
MKLATAAPKPHQTSESSPTHLQIRAKKHPLHHRRYHHATSSPTLKTKLKQHTIPPLEPSSEQIKTTITIRAVVEGVISTAKRNHVSENQL